MLQKILTSKIELQLRDKAKFVSFIAMVVMRMRLLLLSVW